MIKYMDIFANDKRITSLKAKPKVTRQKRRIYRPRLYRQRRPNKASGNDTVVQKYTRSAKLGIRTKPRTKQIKYRSRVKSKSCDSENLICNYGTVPMKEPLLVDNFSFQCRGKFIENLEKIFYNVVDKNPSNLLMGNKDKNAKNFLRDIMTSYMVSNIFKTRNQNKLIHIINTIMKALYEEFYKQTKIRLYFIYRGGNILKIYKSNFEKVLPGRAKKLFQQEFDDYFKNSDIDFYTVIDKAKNLLPEEINLINQYIEMMCYYGLYIARIFIMNNFNLFEFCKLNKVSFKEDFKDLVEIMNNDKKSSEIKEIQNTNIIGLGFNRLFYIDDKHDLDKVLKTKNIQSFVPGIEDNAVSKNILEFQKAGRYDSNLENANDKVYINKIDYTQPNLFKENFEKYMEELVHKNKILDFYITNNNLIEDKLENVSFSLVRIMINFVVFFERDGKYGLTNTSSELFDLAIGHPEDKMYHVYNSENITPYPFKYDDDKTDEIYIPKIRTTLTDLIKILFDIEYPWMDVKYEKRLYRLLLLTFVEELSKSDIYEIEKRLKLKKRREPKSEDDITFETLNYRNDNLKKKATKPDEKTNYKKYMQKYNDINNKLLKVISRIKEFIESKKQFQPKDIYEFSFDPIGIE